MPVPACTSPDVSTAATGAVALPERDMDVRAAEVQLLSTVPDVKGADELDPSDHGHHDDGDDNH